MKNIKILIASYATMDIKKFEFELDLLDKFIKQSIKSNLDGFIETLGLFVKDCEGQGNSV